MSGCRFCKDGDIDKEVWHVGGHLACRSCVEKYKKMSLEHLAPSTSKKENLCGRCHKALVRMYIVKVRRNSEVKEEHVCRDCKRKIREKWLSLLSSREK